MELNTELHQQSRCRFSLHKLHVDLGETAIEAGVFRHRALKNRTASHFILI
jgi:hypothetical protein